jgi:hypothetical protein
MHDFARARLERAARDGAMRRGGRVGQLVRGAPVASRGRRGAAPLRRRAWGEVELAEDSGGVIGVDAHPAGAARAEADLDGKTCFRRQAHARRLGGGGGARWPTSPGAKSGSCSFLCGRPGTTSARSVAWPESTPW